jgi:hypothetical protein
MFPSLFYDTCPYDGQESLPNKPVFVMGQHPLANTLGRADLLRKG